MTNRPSDRPQFPASSSAALLGGVAGAVGCGAVACAVAAWAGANRPGWNGAFGALAGSVLLGVMVAAPGAVAGMFGAGAARRCRARVGADWPPTQTDYAGALLAGSVLTAAVVILFLLAMS